MRTYLFTLLMTAMMLFSCSEKEHNTEYTIITGSYAPADSCGVNLFRVNPSTATYERLGSLKGIKNPSYLAVNSEGTRAYSVGESETEPSAYAISINPATGALEIINHLPTDGAAPCNINISPDGRFVVTANYAGGNISIFGIGKDGGLASGPEVIPFTGHGPDSLRQTQPRLHCVTFTPDSAFLVADDLGTDRLHTFPVIKGGDRLIDTTLMADVVIRPASGPRHLAYHPDGRHAYLINEISGYVTELEYDGKALTPREYVLADTLHAEGAGDIVVTPDGKYVYASCRLKGDGVAVFKVNPADGSLTRVSYTLTGIHPRNIALTPDGEYLLVSCRDSDRIEFYRIDHATGALNDTGFHIDTPKPVCVKFVGAPI